jgi:predicted peptidase
MQNAKRRRHLIFASCILYFAFTACPPGPRFLERKVKVHETTYAYRVWLPRHYTKLHRWPVILFLHGSGERGDDNARQLTVGLPDLLARDPSRVRAIVVLPQCRLEREWYGEMEQQALAALDQSIKEFRGDRHRVYLTGISMGGAGAWYFGRHPERWAAVVPVSSEVTRQPDDPFPQPLPPDLAALLSSRDPFAALAEKIGKTPVWAFHGAGDSVIPVDQARRMVAALRANKGNVRYTEYAGAGHGIWDRAYEEPALAEWMAKQRR